MPAFSKVVFSGGGADGLGIEVVATATAGTLIHTCSSTAAVQDEIWIYANNIHSSAVTLTIEFGGVSVTKDIIQTSLAVTPAGLILIVAGLIVQGNATPKIIRAFASVASKIEIFGYVNRIT